jgi:uncharacterized membrane protein YidH (DUF202 family)
VSGDAGAGDQDDAEDGTHDRGARPFDVGLQPERTALAWRRTALALVVAAVVGIRVLPTLVGAWAVIPAGAGIALAVGILFASHRRYRIQHERLTTATTDRIALPDGALPALVAGTTISAGLACILIVWSTAMR